MKAKIERRKYERLDVHLDGRFSRIGYFNQRAPRINATITNLSPDGLFIETEKVFPIGSVVVVDFFLMGARNHIRAEGMVCWSSKPGEESQKGMGIQFISKN